MKLKIAMVLGVLALGATPVFAGPNDDAIKERQACMKAQGAGVFGGFFPIMKGSKPYDAAVIKETFDKMNAACANWAKFWPEGSDKGETLPTNALPAIWTDKAGFGAASMKAYEAMTALSQAADEAAFKAALPAVGAACNGCHEAYRAPM